MVGVNLGHVDLLWGGLSNQTMMQDAVGVNWTVWPSAFNLLVEEFLDDPSIPCMVGVFGHKHVETVSGSTCVVFE